MMTSSASRTPETRIVEMVFPNQADHYGTLFAGEALRLMDKAALVAASRHASGDGEFRAERFSRTGAARPDCRSRRTGQQSRT